jgi:hypothetical protein
MKKIFSVFLCVFALLFSGCSDRAGIMLFGEDDPEDRDLIAIESNSGTVNVGKGNSVVTNPTPTEPTPEPSE